MRTKLLLWIGFTLVIGIIIGIAGANAPPGSWGIVAGMLGSSILLAIGGGMIAVGVLVKIYRKFR